MPSPPEGLATTDHPEYGGETHCLDPWISSWHGPSQYMGRDAYMGGGVNHLVGVRTIPEYGERRRPCGGLRRLLRNIPEYGEET